MKSTRILTVGFVLLLAVSTAFAASWYDEYEAGLAAAKSGQWSVVIQKMTAAIKGNPKENDKAREYGTIFINYHPYYYRAVAYLNTGKYEQAVSDLEQSSGPGEENLGTIETLMGRAKTKLAQTSAPPPEPQPPAPQPQPRIVPVPVPVQPAAPVIDPALRQQAAAAINQAKARIAAAQQRKAGNTPQYAQATQALTEALMRSANPKSNDDLNVAIASAGNAAAIADLAPAPGAPIPTPSATPTRPTAASSVVLADASRRVRDALESYFRGDFDEASTKFRTLSHDMPTNGYIWAFLGASQYSQYAFEADDNYKDQAMESFRKAKQLRKWSNGLPSKYFSKKIRKVFESAG
jgi:tetratricopeptide (TPR) repeat protein